MKKNGKEFHGGFINQTKKKSKNSSSILKMRLVTVFIVVKS